MLITPHWSNLREACFCVQYPREILLDLCLSIFLHFKQYFPSYVIIGLGNAGLRVAKKPDQK